MYKAFKDKGYNVVQSKKQLASTSNDNKTLGIFSGKPRVICSSKIGSDLGDSLQHGQMDRS